MILKLVSSTSLVILVGLVTLSGCLISSSEHPSASSFDTPWPTLSPLTPLTGTVEAVTENGSPKLVSKFRVDVVDGAMDVYPLEGIADEPVRIEVIVLQGNLDPVIAVSNDHGDQLAYANSAGPGSPEVIGQFQFPDSGYYELGIGTSSAGAGQLGVSIYRFRAGSLTGGGTFTRLGQTLRGTISQPATYQIYRFPAQRGTRFDISASALTEGLDLLFSLFGPQGNLLSSRDDDVGKDPQLLNFMPDQSGEYTVVVTNFDDLVGSYELSVSESSASTVAEVETRTELVIPDPSPTSKWINYVGRALDGLRIEVRPLDLGMDVAVSIYDQYGNRLTTANERGANQSEALSLVQLPFDGPYEIEFISLGEPGRIDYLIQNTRSADMKQGGRVALSNFPRDGMIDETGTMLSYTFDADAGTLISVAARPGAADVTLDLGFDVYGPDGYLLAHHDDDVGKDPIADRIELPLTGRYVVTLWNFGGTHGPFEMLIANSEAPVAPPSGGPTPDTGISIQPD